MKIEGITLAINDMSSMLRFYAESFEIRFEETEMNGFKLYKGSLGEVRILFCPAELAGHTATQNRHQLDIVVSDLDQVMLTALRHGGTILHDVIEDENTRRAGIYDPDMNSLVLKEVKLNNK